LDGESFEDALEYTLIRGERWPVKVGNTGEDNAPDDENANG